jgi:c-di-GMP-binding flagellar brake protein YcgR
MMVAHPERGWGSGRITDISRGGAGLVLFGPPWPRYQSERHLFIRLDVSESISDQPLPFLECVVRCNCATQGGWLRVGVEFAALTPSQNAAATKWLRVLLPENDRHDATHDPPGTNVEYQLSERHP